MGTDEGRLFLNGHVLKLSDGSMGLLLLLSLILYVYYPEYAIIHSRMLKNT